MARDPRGTRFLIPLLATLASCGDSDASDARPVAEVPGDGSHAALVDFFLEWREFERPGFDGEVPDYSAAAMARQAAELPGWMARLAAFEIDAWTVPQQVDWHIIRAEMNGLSFDHAVRRPWARDPAYYVTIYAARSDVPAHEGSEHHGSLDLWAFDRPFSDSDRAFITDRIAAIPALLDQARGNLADSDARDLWMAGLRSFRAQSADLRDFADEVGGQDGALDEVIAAAVRASDAFHDWLEVEVEVKTGASGVGKDNYTWYMRNVHLVPYSWEEQVTMMRRELARSHASLRLEEHRNRGLPELQRIQTPAQFDRRLNAEVDEYLRFLDEEEIHSVFDWMDPALRAVNGQFIPAEPGEIRNFFNEVNYRDPLVMRTHMHHWIELARPPAAGASQLRITPLLYNIWDARSEGLATGVEEMMMHAGLFEGRPRSRELVWIMLAQRAARALSGLYLHGNEFEMEEAVEYAMTWTPRGWLPDGALVRGEQHLYLRQPGYGTSYLSGKIQIEELLAERALQLGDDFTLSGFFDDFFESGIIPTVLVRWEMIGERDAILDGPLGYR
ncbi:MAG: DUF885 family protein [Longimicrobiales bacterium]